MAAKLQPGWEKSLPTFPTDKPVATRNAGQQVMNAIEKVVPELFGGAADLTSSTKTIFKDQPSFHVDPLGKNVFFGVREFGMMAMVNGMAAHGGLIPFGSTFFVFSDYCKPALRLGALMGVHSLYVFTHDSVGLGEDGPTHQPIEHLMALRAGPVPDGLSSGGRERDGGLLEAGAGTEVAMLYGAEPARPAGVRRGAGAGRDTEGRVCAERCGEAGCDFARDCGLRGDDLPARRLRS
jgi:hypothetical protein